MRHFLCVGGCAEIPACTTILNESDFKMLLGQFAVEYSQLGNVDLTLDAMKTYMMYAIMESFKPPGTARKSKCLNFLR